MTMTNAGAPSRFWYCVPSANCTRKQVPTPCPSADSLFRTDPVSMSDLVIANRKPVSPAPSLAQVGLSDERIVEQRACTVGQRDQAAFHDVTPMARFQRQLRVLLDQQYRDAFLRHHTNCIENLLDHERRQ